MHRTSKRKYRKIRKYKKINQMEREKGTGSQRFQMYYDLDTNIYFKGTILSIQKKITAVNKISSMIMGAITSDRSNSYLILSLFYHFPYS